MKALSIRQPWAWAILHAGKDVENRDWSPRYQGYRDALRMVEEGERFLLHASANAHRQELADAIEVISEIAPGVTVPSDIPRGGIVGSAVIVRVVSMSEHRSPWFFGPVGLVLRGVVPLPFVPMSGALGFFDVPDDVLRRIANATPGERG